MLDEAASAFLDSVLSTASEATLTKALGEAARSGDAELTAMIALGFLARRKGLKPTARGVLSALQAADAVLLRG